MFAIIKTGGKQYRVAAQDLITVDRLAGNPGEPVEFSEVLLVGGESVVVGNPTVPGATVAGQLVQQTRGDKVIAFKKRRRKNSRRKRGHRQEHSLIRITDILTEGRSLSAVASEPAPVAEPAPAAEEEAGAGTEAAATPIREDAAPAVEPAE